MKEMELTITLEHTMREIAKFHFILAEGRKGNHLLFTPEMIRHAFSKKQEDVFGIFKDKIDEINKVLNHTFSLQSFEKKTEYIQSLPEDIQSALIVGYFQLLESHIDGQMVEGQIAGPTNPTIH
ncbi:MAG: hypothetical protein KDD48_05450 [Bdellovibrionales bacterium]|nr:hypothetical protein [Bdellovibrionales bacterium]